MATEMEMETLTAFREAGVRAGAVAVPGAEAGAEGSSVVGELAAVGCCGEPQAMTANAKSQTNRIARRAC
jgi:hypothetical protein